MDRIQRYDQEDPRTLDLSTVEKARADETRKEGTINHFTSPNTPEIRVINQSIQFFWSSQNNSARVGVEKI